MWGIAAAAPSTTSGVPTAHVVQSHAYRTKPVSKWTVTDAQEWMNYTIGYPEYSAVILAHLVDGPTLLGLRNDDLVDGFELAHPLHLVKLKAHLKILRSQCLCDVEANDLWAYLNLHHDRVYIGGSAVLTTPRLALLYTYLFKYPLLNDMLGPKALKETDLDDFIPVPDASSGVEGEEDSSSSTTAAAANAASLSEMEQLPWFTTILFWVGTLLFPNLYVLLQLVAGMFTSNPITVLFLIGSLVQAQIAEVVFVYLFFHDIKNRKLPGSLGGWIKYLKAHYNIILWAFPIFAYITSWFVPYFLQNIFIYVYIFGWGGFLTGGLILNLLQIVRHIFSGKGESGEGKKDA